MKSSSKKKSIFSTSYHSTVSSTDNSEKVNNSCGFGIVCTKSLAIIFNFLLVFSGILLVLSSIYTVLYRQDFIDLFSSNIYQISTILIIVAGFLVFITGFVGIFIVWNESKKALIYYLIFLTLIIVVEFSAAFMAFNYRATLNNSLREDMNRIIKHEYAQTGFESQTARFDEFQQKFKCCGANDFTDWVGSNYILMQQASAKDNLYNKVSESCCKSPSENCAIRDHPSNINSNGCASVFEDSISDHILLYGLFVLSVCFFQLCGIFLVGMLLRRIGEKKKYEFISNNTSEIIS